MKGHLSYKEILGTFSTILLCLMQNATPQDHEIRKNSRFNFAENTIRSSLKVL